MNRATEMSVFGHIYTKEVTDMLNIEKALSVYSDKLSEKIEVNVQEIARQLPEADQKEFLELAEIVEMTMQINTTNEFETFFGKLDAQKEKLYSYDNVANFHSEKGAEQNSDVIDRLFEEEFGKDE